MQPQTKECQHLPKLKEARNRCSPGSPGDIWLCWNLASDTVLCYGRPFTIAMREYICLVWSRKLVFICYCSRWKYTRSERGHFFSLPFTGRRNLSLKTHCTPPLRSCELSSSFKDAEIEASGIFSLYKSLSENIYENSFVQTMAFTMWHSGHVIDSRRDIETDWPNPRAQCWYLDSNTDCTLQVNGFTSIWVSLSSLLSESVDPHILPWQHLVTFPRVSSYQAMAWLTFSYIAPSQGNPSWGRWVSLATLSHSIPRSDPWFCLPRGCPQAREVCS